MNFRSIHRSAFFGILLAACPASAAASSFQILEQSPSRLGTAFAGTASAADDATTAFFNPAGMAHLDRPHLTVGGNVIMVESAFDDEGSTAGDGTAVERPLPGTEDETNEPGIVPNLYYVQPIADRWAFGISVTAPFGLSSDYDEDWQGRYHATESELRTINVNPTVAFELNEQLSLGVGISYQYADVTLKNEVDSYRACREAGGTIATCATRHGGPGNPTADSSASITGDDDDLIADFSLHWQPTQRTAIGLAWREGGEFELAGEADFTPSASCTQDPFCSGALAVLEGDAKARASLPDTLTLSVSHEYGGHLTLHADLARTQWSTLQSITIRNSDNGATIDTLELEYNNTVRAALGADYETGAWTLRGGIAHDEAPNTHPRFVTPRIPDADRLWLSTGFNYAFSKSASIDVGYAHLFVDEASIDKVAQGNRLRGDFEARGDILGVQVNWRF